MAYLKEIQEWCQAPACQAKAKVEMFGTRNNSYGKFCLRCGKVKKKLLDKRESEVRVALGQEEP